MRKIVAILVGTMLTTPALGQAPGLRDSGLSRSDGVVGLGVTIPLGGARQKSPARIELRIARDMVNVDGSRQSSAAFRSIETRIGFTLEQDRKLLVNGRTLGTTRRQNVSTGAGIAIGVVAALVIGGLLIADAARDASE